MTMGVPKNLLQLWIGKKPLPPNCTKWCDQFMRMNPDWKYHFFGNDLYEKYGSDPYVKQLVNMNAELAFIADRFRVLLLRDVGGVYIDVDAKPVRPLSTLDRIWHNPKVDFVAGMRSPDRRGIALHRGISFVDNTVFASAEDGRMATRLCNLYTPEFPKQTGYSQGLEILRNADDSTVLLNFKYFYAEQSFPETILLHDGHNLGTWQPTRNLPQTCPA